MCRLTGQVGNESGRFESRKQKAEIEARRRKPPKATPRPPQGHILGIDSGVQSHPKATPRLPQGYPKATPRLPQGSPKATPRLHQGYPKATPQAVDGDQPGF